jgi:hypothetical protein
MKTPNSVSSEPGAGHSQPQFRELECVARQHTLAGKVGRKDSLAQICRTISND